MASGWWALSHLGTLRPPFSVTGTVIGKATFPLSLFVVLTFLRNICGETCERAQEGDKMRLLSLGQHVTTFDLRHYQFLGSCSYLLTKDFVGGDFEVIGEYESAGGLIRLKSVVVRGQGTDVTLHVDGTVVERSVAGQVCNPCQYLIVRHYYNDGNIL